MSDASQFSTVDTHSGYATRRAEIEHYFDRTAAKAWERLTSDAPVSGIRATVRAGRDRMRATLLSWLPPDLSGLRLLDAGCGTGALAVEAAARGADVVAVDLSPNLIEVARDRMPKGLSGTVTWHAGDMLDPALGRFDHVIAMDSVIHYESTDKVAALAGLATRAKRSVLFTFPPSNPALTAMHTVGKLFPRGDRAPAIVPVAERTMRRLIGRSSDLATFTISNTETIRSGFYTSQAMQIVQTDSLGGTA
ncbi:MAG: magnesium protoporphyrin IX methyltransferase [Pseudomonadota bacterium]